MPEGEASTNKHRISYIYSTAGKMFNMKLHKPNGCNTEFKNGSPNTFPTYNCPLCQRYSRFEYKEAQVNTWSLSSSGFPRQKWQALCCRCWSRSFKGHLILQRFLWPMTFISSDTCDLPVLEHTACSSARAKLLSLSCVFSRAGTTCLLQDTSDYF